MAFPTLLSPIPSLPSRVGDVCTDRHDSNEQHERNPPNHLRASARHGFLTLYFAGHRRVIITILWTRHLNFTMEPEQ